MSTVVKISGVDAEVINAALQQSRFKNLHATTVGDHVEIKVEGKHHGLKELLISEARVAEQNIRFSGDKSAAC